MRVVHKLKKLVFVHIILESNENGELIIRLLSKAASILIQTGSIMLKITLCDIWSFSLQEKKEKKWAREERLEGLKKFQVNKSAALIQEFSQRIENKIGL